MALWRFSFVALSVGLYAGEARVAELLMSGNATAARVLVEQKADVNAAQGDGMTPLHWAVYHDDFETARLLLKAGAKVNVETRVNAITPLFMACANGNATMIDLLVQAGANPKSVKPNGATALMTAAASGSVDAVRVLLDAGAELEAKEKVHEQTALMFASALNRVEVVTFLLSRHACKFGNIGLRGLAARSFACQVFCQFTNRRGFACTVHAGHHDDRGLLLANHQRLLQWF